MMYFECIFQNELLTRAHADSVKGDSFLLLHGTYIKIKQIMISNTPPTIVLVYSDSCMHCRMFAPVWEEFEMRYKSKFPLSKILKIDRDLLRTEKGAFMTKLSKSFNGYVPFICVFDANGNVNEYSGSRTVEDIEAFASQFMLDATTKIQLKTSTKKTSGYTSSGNNTSRRAYLELKTVKELKDMLRHGGFTLRGKKKDQIDRLCELSVKDFRQLSIYVQRGGAISQDECAVGTVFCPKEKRCRRPSASC